MYKRSRLVCWLFGVLASVLLPDFAIAQFSNLDKAGAQCAKQLKSGKARLVAVADFDTPDGTVQKSAAHYLAWFLSSSIHEHEKKHLAVADHLAFDKDLTKLKIFPLTPNSVEGLAAQAQNTDIATARADIVILGTVIKRGDWYLLEITQVQSSTGAKLAPIEVSMRLSEFLESFLRPFPLPEFLPVFKAGVGTSVPRCIHCPDPSYNDLAREARVQGICVLEVVISKEGQILQVRPVKLLGYGLDEAAYDALKHWQLAPVTNKEGTPVNAVVPIEVSFRLY